MLKPTPRSRKIYRQARFRFAIIASEYNAKFVQGPGRRPREDSAWLMPKVDVLSIIEVPGAFRAFRCSCCGGPFGAWRGNLRSSLRVILQGKCTPTLLRKA